MTTPDEGFPLAEITRFYADRRPDDVAVRCDADELTWSGLHAAGNRVSHGLLRSGVTTGRLVSLLLPNSIDMIVAVRHPAPDEKDQRIAVVSPCGACRELIFDYDQQARVIVPNGASAAVVPIGKLLPNKYSRGPER